jgi:MFS family permease
MPIAVFTAAFLFNLGQGVLRPSLPLYLQQSFAANYRMVTLIPVVFGAGKWVASLPTGYLLDRLGRRRLMVTGLLLIACIDVASAVTLVFGLFLGLRALGGVGWAMFGTVATTTMVDHPGAGRRGQAISLLLMSETLGLLLGSAAGGFIYQNVGTASPFVFEAACMLLAALVVGARPAPRVEHGSAPPRVASDRRLLWSVLRVPGVLLMSLTSAALMAIQTGALVFLFPLYLVEQGRLRPETVGYLVSLGVLGRLLALWLGGSASDRWGRLPVLIPGLLGYGALLASLTLVTQPVLLGLWSLMIGAGAGFVASLPTAIVGDRVAPPLQGIAIGWLRTVTDGGMLLGPLVMGALADAAHLAAAFLFAGALAGALAWRCHRHAIRVSS